MIDPTKITKYNRTRVELEELLLFCIAVSGKTAKTTARMLDELLKRGVGSPFEVVLQLESQLPMIMKEIGFGCQKMKARGFIEAAKSKLDLESCSASDLEKIHGVAFKTSRFFILHSRRNARIACLDRHVLSFLRDLGYDAPETTPTSAAKYRNLENIFIELANKFKKTPSQLDLIVWRVFSKNALSTDVVLLDKIYEDRFAVKG